jgi:hypothetical protein
MPPPILRFQINSLFLHSPRRRGQPDTVPIRKDCVEIRYPTVYEGDLDVLTGNSGPLDQILNRMTFIQIVRSVRIKTTAILIGQF